MLITISNYSWIDLKPNIPSACQQQIDEFSGITVSDFEKNPTRLHLVKVEIWCKGEQVFWPQATVELPKFGLRKLIWYRLGDRLGLTKINIAKATFPELKIRSENHTRIFNISNQNRFLSRNAVFWYIQNKATYYLDKDHAAIFKALVTADRSKLSKEWKKRFQNLGITHLFAISGMHIGILYLWLSLVIRLFISFPFNWIEQGYGTLIIDVSAVVLIYLYLDLIGMPLTASRALIMLTWWIVARHFLSWQPTWFILIGTALIILVDDPLAIGQISFQLSFISVAGILYVFSYLPRRRLTDSIGVVVLKTIISSALISFWLFLLTFPLVDMLAPEHSVLCVVNNVIHILFLSIVFVPMLMFAVVFTLLGYPVFGLPGEFFVFSVTNLINKIWIKLLMWNIQWNQMFLWDPEWDWRPLRILIYWISLLIALKALPLVFPRLNQKIN